MLNSNKKPQENAGFLVIEIYLICIVSPCLWEGKSVKH